MEEPRITQATQEVPEPASIENSIDAIELTDKDLEKVTGAYWGGGGVALNQAAIAGRGGGVALNQAAIAR